MSKDCAVKNYVSPILYYNPNFIPASAMENWTKLLVAKRSDIEDVVFNVMNLMFSFMKQYKDRYFNRNTGTFSQEEKIFI